MEFEKYTDRAKGFLQSAQTLALRRGHQRLTPEHLLKVLLEDSEGLCANLIRAAGGDPKAALTAVDAELDRLPRVEGSGAGQVYMSPELARVFEQAEQLAQRAGDSFVTVERLLLALAAAAGTGAATASGGAAAATPGVPAGPVHLNTATLEQLDSLPGVGPVTAQKILDYRQELGAFSSVDELDAVPGIGPARMDTLRDLVAP
jgi:competence ComEA-like helix-hairpin-helix protein